MMTCEDRPTNFVNIAPLVSFLFSGFLCQSYLVRWNGQLGLSTVSRIFTFAGMFGNCTWFLFEIFKLQCYNETLSMWVFLNRMEAEVGTELVIFRFYAFILHTAYSTASINFRFGDKEVLFSSYLLAIFRQTMPKARQIEVRPRIHFRCLQWNYKESHFGETCDYIHPPSLYLLNTLDIQWLDSKTTFDSPLQTWEQYIQPSLRRGLSICDNFKSRVVSERCI